jgi:hypothetical protein
MISEKYIDDYDLIVNMIKYNPPNTNQIIKAYKSKLSEIEVIENSMKHKIVFNTTKSINPLIAIPTIIDITDNRSPHTIPLYRRMMQLYLGIIPKVIASRGKLRNKNGDNINSTDPITEIRTTSQKKDIWELCGRMVTITAEYKDLMYFPNSLNISCFIPGCDKRINSVHTFQIGNEIIVCFDVGSIHIDPDIISEPKMFETWLDQLLIILTTTQINRIILCGHSNGMSSATIVAFLLLYIKNKEIIKLLSTIYQFNKNVFDYLDTIRSKWNILENIQLFVVGTAGFPVLFSTQEQFNLFYKMIYGRYLHIVMSRKPYANIQELYDMCGFDPKFNRIDQNIKIINDTLEYENSDNKIPLGYLKNINTELNKINGIIRSYPHKIFKEFSSEWREYKIPLVVFISKMDKLIKVMNKIFRDVIETENKFRDIKDNIGFMKIYNSQYKNYLNTLKLTFAAIIHYIVKIKEYINDPDQDNIDGFSSPVLYNDFKNFKFALYYSNNCYAKMVNGIIPIGNYIYKDNDIEIGRAHV